MKGRIRNNGMFNTQVINRNIVDGLMKEKEASFINDADLKRFCEASGLYKSSTSKIR